MAPRLIPVTKELRELRERSGLSMAKIAAAIGLRGGSSYQRYEDPALFKENYLPLELTRKLAGALSGKGSPPIEAHEVYALAGLTIDEQGRIVEATLDAAANLGAEAIRNFRSVPVPPIATMDKDVRVLGTAVGGVSSDFTLNGGDVIDFVRRPPGIIAAKNVFAIYVAGSSMSPRFEEGELIYLNPDRPARPGDDVVIEMRPDPREPGAAAYLKRLVRRTATKIICEQFNPPRDDVEFSLAQVKHIHRVMTAAELLGV